MQHKLEVDAVMKAKLLGMWWLLLLQAGSGHHAGV
jgi:hypothetical protein